MFSEWCDLCVLMCSVRVVDLVMKKVVMNFGASLFPAATANTTQPFMSADASAASDHVHLDKPRAFREGATCP